MLALSEYDPLFSAMAWSAVLPGARSSTAATRGEDVRVRGVERVPAGKGQAHAEHPELAVLLGQQRSDRLRRRGRGVRREAGAQRDTAVQTPLGTESDAGGVVVLLYEDAGRRAALESDRELVEGLPANIRVLRAERRVREPRIGEAGLDLRRVPDLGGHLLRRERATGGELLREDRVQLGAGRKGR
jgi:hypothetical protein